MLSTFLFIRPAAAQEGGEKLYTFSDGADGADPIGNLVLAGNTLYGVTYQNSNLGEQGFGTVFKINTDGTGFNVLYAFGGGNDGSNPAGGLILSGDTLYGTSTGNYGSTYGSVFSIKTNGTGFTILHTFTNGSDGSNPYGKLFITNGTLYGMATYGGANGGGTVFKVETDGTGFTVVYSLGNVGYNAFGGLTLSGSTLYGVLNAGGTGGYGTIFKVSTNGTGYTTIHNFNGSDGGYPFATLTIDGNTLYGTTSAGSTNDYGSVFKIKTGGTGFATLYSFSGGPDGGAPQEGLTLSDGKLYGTASGIGPFGNGISQGAVFSLSTNGSDFTVLHSFDCNQATAYYDGENPIGNVIVSGTTVYGTARSGGSASLDGIIYSLFPCRTITLAPADTAYMNFDSVDTSTGRVDATSYLASFGITLTNVNPPGSVFIANSISDGCGTASSAPNWISQYVGGSSLVSYTLAFSTPLESVTFTRCAVGVNCASPIWTATAYAGTNQASSVGVCCLDSDTGQPANTYTLNGPGITSLTISANGEDFSAYSSPELDDFYLNAALPNPVFGAPYSQSIIASDDTAPCTFAVTGGSLPNGLSLSSSGVISGTPTASGTFSFTVAATDFYGCAGSSNYLLSVPCPTISVNPTTLADGVAGMAYETTILASGGASPYTFSVSAGSLPPGLSLVSSNGVISGTPTTSGAFNFTIQASDADACVGSNSYSVFICTPATQYNVTGGGAYCSGGSGVAIGLNGSQPGYNYQLIYDGFVELETVAGTGSPISFGNQTGAGTYAVLAYSASTPCSTAMSGRATITVNALPSITTASLPDAMYGSVYNQTVTNSGAANVNATGLPAGLSMDNSGIVSGTPTVTGMFNVTVTATSAAGCSTSAIISLSVDKATPTFTLLSSENPSGYRDSMSFTATNLPVDVTSNVVFQANGAAFSTNNVMNGGATSLAITNLPRGTTNLIAANYSGDNNYQPATASLTQTVTNHPPMAASMIVQRTAGFPLTIAFSDIATNWSDVDGDTVTLAGVDLVTTNNLSLTTNSTDIFYTNGPEVDDQFSYTITDGFGGTDVGLVNIEVIPGGTNAIVSITSGANETILMANGVSGYTYVAQRSTNLVSAVWVNIATNVAATNGVISVVDTFSDLGGRSPPQAYYRITWSP